MGNPRMLQTACVCVSTDPMLEPIRNLEQNARMWAMLTDVSNQTDWPVNGRMGKLSKEDWKDIFSAELRKEQRIAQGISGGFVLLGAHTHKMKKRELSDMIEIMFAFGAERSIAWSDPDAPADSAFEVATQI